MFNTRVEVDKHVENCLKKINSDKERNLRSFTFAKLYHKVGDYEQARRYVLMYLTLKPTSAEGQHLLGVVLEKLGKKEAALDAYRNSLNLDPKQNSLVLKVCELLAAEEVDLDNSGAQFFCEKAQSLDPSNPSVFQLKQKLVLRNSKDPNDVTKLLLEELESRPTDVDIRIRLLRHLMQSNQLKEAYRHTSEIERKNMGVFVNNLKWYEAISEVLLKYHRENSAGGGLTWEYWFLVVSALDRVTALSLDERFENIGNSARYITHLFNFDQTLKLAAESIGTCPEKQLTREFLTHYRGQLCLHLATLLYKQARTDRLQYRDATQLALPLLFAAYHVTPADVHALWLEHSGGVGGGRIKAREQMQRWHVEGAYRCSQAGHVLVEAARDRQGAAVVARANQTATGLWREQVFKKVFGTRECQAKIKSSFFVTTSDLLDLPFRLPDPHTELLPLHDPLSQLAHPDSLHHYVWLYLNHHRHLAALSLTPVFTSAATNLTSSNSLNSNNHLNGNSNNTGLPFSVKNLNNCAAETLNVLDVQAFVYCAVLCVRGQQWSGGRRQGGGGGGGRRYGGGDGESGGGGLLPAAVTEQLGSSAQSKWLQAAYTMHRSGQYSADMSEMRLTLIRGIEVVRCMGNHGLDVSLLVTLAKTFEERAKNCKGQTETEFNEARSELYWKAAMPLLERLKNKHPISYSTKRLFDYHAKELSDDELQQALDAGRLHNALVLMRKREHDAALHQLEQLRDPYASYHRAGIYRHLAEEQTGGGNRESVTSEMRSRHIILLSRARDCYYLTLDRLRDPAVDRGHPLNAVLSGDIERVEKLLSRIDPDVLGATGGGGGLGIGAGGERHDGCDGNSEVDMSSVGGSVGENYNIGSYAAVNHLHTPTYAGANTAMNGVHTTPYRLDTVRREARPSPERLDAQLRQLTATKDAALGQILEQNKCIIEAHRMLVEELRGFKESINGLTTTVADLNHIKAAVDDLKGIKTSFEELKLAVEDLQSLRNVSDVVQELKREMTELKRDTSKIKSQQISDEDLYALDEEYGTDYASLNSSMAAALGGGLYPSLPRLGQPQQAAVAAAAAAAAVNTMPYPPAALYPGMYHPMYPFGGLGVSQGALPFGPDGHLNDFRALNALQPNLNQPVGLPTSAYPNPIQLPPQQHTVPLPHVLQPQTLSQLPQANITTSPLLGASLQAMFRDTSTPAVSFPLTTTAFTNNVVQKPSFYDLPTTVVSTTVKTNAPPVNVVITSSDPLPLIKNATTSQILSVTIPPQHLKGNQPPKPHNYQIPLPLPSNVFAEQNPAKTLGLQVEKSLGANFPTTEPAAGADFKPIVEIPVTTGEENETVVFCGRGKCYRFVQGEWKERGVGDLKLLKSASDGRVRVVLRNEKQQNRVCANHHLTPDMTITAKVNSEKAFLWTANDFSDGVNSVEKFCVQFETPAVAQLFKEKFEECKMPQQSVTAKNLGGFVFTSSTPSFQPKDEAPKTPTNVTVPVETVASTAKSSPFAGFSFLSPAKATDTPAVTSSGMLKTPEREPVSDDFVPTAEFKPVIPLPELVDVKTGEENAEILFESRSKLLRYDSTNKEWKERGIGQMKILKDDSMVRLVMRREVIHKLCCNHQLLNSIEFSRMSNKKAISWYAMDYSEGVTETQMFAIRFKTEELASDFLDAINSAKAMLDDKSKVKGHAPSKTTSGESEKKIRANNPVTTSPVKSGFGDKFKPKSGSWSCKICYIHNEGKDNYCVACETPKNDSVPKKVPEGSGGVTFGIKPLDGVMGGGFTFGIPTTIASQATVKPDGGFKMTFGAAPVAKSDVVVAPLVTSSSSFGGSFKPEEGSWECKECYVRNNAGIADCVSCQTPKDPNAKKESKQNQSNLPSGLTFSGSLAEPKTPTNTPTAKFTFGIPTPSSKFSFVTGSSVPAQTTTAALPPAVTTTLASNTGFSFLSSAATTTTTITPTDFSFGSLHRHGFDFQPRSPRRISGGDGNLSSTATPTTPTPAGGGDESEHSYAEDDNSSDNIYFKPVIPLPDEVAVVTGEEGEQVLYEQRCKLFRFVGGEWKERGLGNVRVLRETASGKLRVLMRREVIHKICLNHRLTGETVYTAKDAKTWMFTAGDFSEGVLEWHQFCVRFRTVELAAEFKETVDAAVAADDGSSDMNDGAAAVEKDSNEEPTDDVIFVSETTITEAERNEALALKLPAKFMSYRQLSDCTCEQCARDDIYCATPKTPVSEKSESVRELLAKPTKFIFGQPDAAKTPPATKSNTFSITNPGLFSSSPSVGVFGTSSPSVPSSTAPLQLKPSKISLTQESSTTSTPSPAAGLFSTPTGSVFGTHTTTSNTNTTNSSSLFGSSTAVTPNTTLFGSTAVTPITTVSSNIFGGGAAATPVSTNLFAGTPNNSTTNLFGGSGIGAGLFGTINTPSKPVFGGSIFGTQPSTPSNTSIFGGGTASSGPTTGGIFSGSLFGGGSTVTAASGNSLFGGGGEMTSLSFKPVETTAPVKEAPVNTTGDMFTVSDSTASFASLATKADTSAFTKTTGENETPFKFLGAGASVFGARTMGAVAAKTGVATPDTSVTTTGEDQEGGGDDSTVGGTGEEYDPHYEPIVPLPDKIVVTTGEEEEEVLFNQRSKLYRYDNDLKEWKERGVGELKLLHHPGNKTYRLLLRRETVHKIVLNSLVTVDLNLQPMSTSDCAWLWMAHNYLEEGHLVHEKLAAKFKNCDQATLFYNKVQLAINEVVKIKAESSVTETEEIPQTVPTTVSTTTGVMFGGGGNSVMFGGGAGVGFGVGSMTQQQVHQEEETDEDEDEDRDDHDGDEGDDDYEDDEERTIMYSKPCLLTETLENGSLKTIGSGQLQVYYDEDFFGARISFIDEQGEITSNTIIGLNTVMNLVENCCSWKAVEWVNNLFEWRTLNATFNTVQEAEECYYNYQEGIVYAEKSDIVDSIPTFSESNE